MGETIYHLYHHIVGTQAKETCENWVEQYKGQGYPLWAHMLKCYAQMHSTHDLYDIQQVGFSSCVRQAVACCCMNGTVKQSINGLSAPVYVRSIGWHIQYHGE